MATTTRHSTVGATRSRPRGGVRSEPEETPLELMVGQARVDPTRLTPQQVERLQSTAGNGAVVQLLGGGAFTRRLIDRAIKEFLPRDPIRDVVRKAMAYKEIADQAQGGVFWGNYCGKGSRNPGDRIGPGAKAVTDSLDQCCKDHDVGYGAFGVDGDSQFTAKNIWKVRQVNVEVTGCAARHRSAVAKKKDAVTGVRGDDAAEGVAGLFGAMATAGMAIEAAIDAVDAVPFVSRKEAERFVFRDVNGLIQKTGGIGQLEALF